MSWTRPRELRAQLQRLWDRGDLLRGYVTDEPSFPRRLTLKSPTSVQLTERFEDVRAWIAELRAQPHYRVEMRSIKHRVLGVNQVPKAVWVDAREDALAVLGMRREAERFLALVDCTRKRRPPLLAWLAKKPLQAVALADSWDRLLDVIDWLVAHPRPNVYLRQVDIPGVHSKFIETHRGVLTQWLDRVLPRDHIDAEATGVSGFAQRFGFRDKPQRIRFRVLDPAHAPSPLFRDSDITLDSASFARLEPGVSRVFITENETNFLAFPPVKDSLVVFGAGYGFDVLARAAFLARCRVHYWGDIDTHGFAILDQLRAYFPHARSLLMDRATLLSFEAQWGEEERQTLRDLPRLNDEEQALYDDLRDNRLRPRLRLEQERIGFGWVERSLANIGSRFEDTVGLPSR